VTEANRTGIAYVSSEMEWYLELTQHLLDTANNNAAKTSYDEVMKQLGQNVVSLYKAILIYQMRSASPMVEIKAGTSCFNSQSGMTGFVL